MERLFYIRTFGCQMNDHDSERISHLLSAHNYTHTDDPAIADLILVNTCSIRQKAEEKLYSEMGRFRRFKEKNPRLLLGVCGCVAQQEGPSLLDRMSYIDFILGTHQIQSLPNLIEDLNQNRRPLSLTDWVHNEDLRFSNVIPDGKLNKVTSFVTIMEGCDNYCSYCVVPYVRGHEISRASDDILDEIRALAERGVREVTLIGQNVNSYGIKKEGEIGLSRMLRLVNDIDGLYRVRFTTSHPKDLSDNLINCFNNGLDKLCEHIHLPIQSGSNTVLRCMRRQYTKEEYLEKVQKLRERKPGIAITSDFIVGFPGETDKDFEDTLDVVNKVKYENIFSFRYSPRPGTLAAKMPDQVPYHIKSERLSILQDIQKRITLEKQKSLEGKIGEVLIEGESKRGNMVYGRLRTNQVLNLPGGKELIGELVKVKITHGYQNSLRGELI